VAVRLAAAGYPLILLSKSEEHLEETRTLCAAVPALGVVADLRNPDDVVRLREALRQTTYLHAVVNNAGVGDWQPIDEMSVESWDDQLDTNLRGPFLVVRETLKHFQRQGEGLYINIGSDCSLVGMANRAAYNASKFGLVGLTACLRAEAGPLGVHSCMVYAGKVDTYFRGHQPGERPGALSADDAAEVIEFVIRMYPRVVIGEVSVFPPSGGLCGPRSLI
jgi:NAD(P)-dependent dehydrogenase (short-subunit alcohol dehydrogenase family)